MDAGDGREGSAEETAWANQVVFERADLSGDLLPPSLCKQAQYSEKEPSIGDALELCVGMKKVN